MTIAEKEFEIVDVFQNSVAVADSWVKNPNKTGNGNGEAKLYIANKDKMHEFYGGNGFSAHCFITKQDLLTYMNATKTEYQNPSQNYRSKDKMQDLWKMRIETIKSLPDIIEFNVDDQKQIEGVRGYVNSNDSAYQLIREIALPYISYISTMHLKDGDSDIYYWKLFADFAEMERRKNFVINYGKKGEEILTPKIEVKETSKTKEYRYARDGQGKYREALLEECPLCPITGITKPELLIASHIKPWAVCDNVEKIDPKNGFILSPLYDKLFDRGFITFTTDRRVKITNWLSEYDKKRIGIKDNQQIPLLPIDDERENYLEYHNSVVFRN